MGENKDFLECLKERQKCIKIGNKFDYLEEFDETEQSRGQIRKKVEPWLSAVLQSEHLSMLIPSYGHIISAISAHNTIIN